MALEPGVLSVTCEFAKDLKDKDLFGKQDPYAKLKVGGQTFKTKTHNRGGKNPVWNETFHFNIINENMLDIEIYDEDTVSDDFIGRAQVQLAKTREQGSDTVQAPVYSKSGKQHGFVSLKLSFAKNAALKAGASPFPQAAPPPAAYGAATGYPAPYPPQGAPYGAYPAQPPPGAYPGPAPGAAYPAPYPPPSGTSGSSPYPPPSAGHSGSSPYPPPSGSSASGYPYPPPGGHSGSSPYPPPGGSGPSGYPPPYAPHGQPAAYHGPPPAGYPTAGHPMPAPGGYAVMPPGYQGQHGKKKKQGLGGGAGLALGALGGLAIGAMLGEAFD